MKVKELIAILQEYVEDSDADDLQVVVGNTPIHFIDCVPSYYDGREQVLIEDENLKGKCYSIIGAKYKSNGFKVRIHTHSIGDAIFDNYKLPINYSECGTLKDYYKKADDEERKKTYDIRSKIDSEHFIDWVQKNVMGVSLGTIQKVAKEFYDKHLNFQDSITITPPKVNPDGSEFWNSFHNCRELQWKQDIELSVVYGKNNYTELQIRLIPQ